MATATVVEQGHISLTATALVGVKAVHKATGIPLETPLDESGEMLTTVSKEAAANKFSGFLSHFHLKRSKIDCAGLDIKKILEEIKSEL